MNDPCGASFPGDGVPDASSGAGAVAPGEPDVSSGSLVASLAAEDDAIDAALVPVATMLERYAAVVSPRPPDGLDGRILATLRHVRRPGPLGAVVAALHAGSPHAVTRAVADALRGALPPRHAPGRWSGPGSS